MADEHQEQPELPTWLADQVGALARDEAEAVAAAWARVKKHVPAQVLDALPDDVLVGAHENRGVWRFLDVDTGGRLPRSGSGPMTTS